MKEGEEYWKKRTHNPNMKLIVDWALEKFIPDWNTLKSRNDSEWLCKTLIEWSEKWNLTADWCLDFALECLRICKVDLIDEFQIPENYLTINAFELLRKYSNFWQGGFAWNSALGKQIWKNQNNYSIADEISRYPEFNYVWIHKRRWFGYYIKVKRTYYPLSRWTKISRYLEN